MADEQKVSGKVGIDPTDFKIGVNGMYRDLRVLESGFRASAAELGNWSNSATGLESRIKSLNSQIDIQKKIVEANRAEYLRLVEAHGAESRAAEDQQIKLNKSTEQLGKMENELKDTKGALTEMKTDEQKAGTATQELGNEADTSGKKFETFKSILGGFGTVIKGTVIGIATVGTAVAGAVVGLGKLVGSAAQSADQLDEMSTKTGISTERLQELSFIGKVVGTDLETVTSANAKMIRSMAAAEKGTGAQAEAFKTLGVHVTDANGNLRDANDVFNETIDKLGQVKNPTEADALAMDIFGKSAQELNPLIKEGAAGLATLRDEAHKTGAVVSGETITALGNLNDQWDELKSGLSGLGSLLAGAFAPLASGILTTALDDLKLLVGIVQGSGGDFGKMAEGITGLFSNIVTSIAQGLPKLAQIGLGIIKSILSAILSALPTLIPAGVGIINTLIDFLVQNVPLLVDAAVQIIDALVNGLLPQLPRLIDAALQIIVTLANGITKMLPTLLPTIVKILIQIVQVLIKNLPLLVNAALQLMLALAHGLVVALPILIRAVPILVTTLVKTILANLPEILSVAAQIILALVAGIIDNLPVLLDAGRELIVNLGIALSVLVTSTLPKIGKSLLDTFLKGMKDYKGTFFGQVITFFVQVINQIKSILSQSVQMGVEFIQGLIQGIQAAEGWLYDVIVSMVQNLVSLITGGLLGGGGSGGGTTGGGTGPVKSINAFARNFAQGQQQFATGSGAGMSLGAATVQNNTFQFFAPVVIQGDTPPGSLGAAVKGRLY